jgi:hypothetical protein
MESKEGDDINVYDGNHFNQSAFTKRLNDHLASSDFEKKLEVRLRLLPLCLSISPPPPPSPAHLSL